MNSGDTVAVSRPTVDPDYLALLQKRVEVAKARLMHARAMDDAGVGASFQIPEAELALLEAEFALRQAQRETAQPRRETATVSPHSGDTVPVSLAPRSLLVQGKTFEQWREQLLTELDPTIRAEAFRAFALFGANGRGKEATEAIVEAVKRLDFSTYGGNDPTERMKMVAIEAFTFRTVRIPFEDSLPIFMGKLWDGNRNERSFVKAILIEMLYLTEEDEATMIKVLREIIQRNDTKQFQAWFADVTPPVFHEGDTHLLPLNGDGTPPLGLLPLVVMGSQRGVITDVNGTHFIVGPRLTPFGHSLLALLRSEGVVSSNELIRTTSQQVVDALVQIEELEEQ